MDGPWILELGRQVDGEAGCPEFMRCVCYLILPNNSCSRPALYNIVAMFQDR